MQHVVTRPREPFASASGGLEIHQIPAWQDNLIWLIVNPTTGEAAAVDGPEAQGTLDYCDSRGLRLTTILNTHTHGDHVGINTDLAGRGQLAGMRVVGPALAARDVPGITEEVSGADRFALFGQTVDVLLTEGHINGHISFVVDGVLFCGDTLFGAGCGYLFDGPPAKMHDSLSRLAALPGDTVVCCAHEYTEDNLRFAWSVEADNDALAERIRDAWRVRAEGRSTIPSTIALEKSTNPFMRTDSETIRKAVAAAFPKRTLKEPTEVFSATRALKDQKQYRERSDDVLPL